jgi:hypothetical protein
VCQIRVVFQKKGHKFFDPAPRFLTAGFRVNALRLTPRKIFSKTQKISESALAGEDVNTPTTNWKMAPSFQSSTFFLP